MWCYISVFVLFIPLNAPRSRAANHVHWECEEILRCVERKKNKFNVDAERHPKGYLEELRSVIADPNFTEPETAIRKMSLRNSFRILRPVPRKILFLLSASNVHPYSDRCTRFWSYSMACFLFVCFVVVIF